MTTKTAEGMPAGKKRLQMPMVSLKFFEWETLMKKQISREVEKRTVANASRKRRNRPGRTAVRETISALFPDPEELLTEALSIHIAWYGQVANAEAGFDLGLKPHHVIIDGPSGHAAVFATIDSGACAKLQEFDGARQLWRHLTLERSQRYESLGITSTEFDEEEAIMDLMVAALPYTTQTIGMSTPPEIIERAFEKRLGEFDAVAALRSRAPDAHLPTAEHSVARSPVRSRTLHWSAREKF